MDEDNSQGFGGGVTTGYRVAASLGEWTLSSVGPGLYVLKADCLTVVPAMLAFAPLTLWIPKGSLRWSWVLDEVLSAEGRIEVVVGAPTLGPLKGS